MGIMAQTMKVGFLYGLPNFTVITYCAPAMFTESNKKYYYHLNTDSPAKKSRVQTGEELTSGDGDAVNMDTQEPLETLGKNEEQGINTVKEPTKLSPQPNIYQG